MDGISLAHVKNGSNSDISDTFKSNYDVIFIDVTGQANLASTLSLPTYLYVSTCDMFSSFGIKVRNDNEK